jgi:hypothetical protein
MRRQIIEYTTILFPLATASILAQFETSQVALNYQNPALYQFYTAAYVHANASHLLGNIVGYLLSVPPLYALYVHQDRRGEFFAAFALIVLAVPVISNVASYLTWGVYADLPIQYGRGLSGVVAAFVGLLLMRVLGTFDEELSEENAMYAASVVGITLFASWAVMFAGTIRLLMLAMLGIMLAVVVYASWTDNIAMAGLGEWARENQRLALILFVGTFTALYMVVLSFPADVQNQGGFTNLVSHGAGFFSGMAIHYWQRR